MRYLLFSLVLLLLNGCAETDVDKILKQMTLEEKIGQIFMVGNMGQGLLSKELFEKYHIGNTIPSPSIRF